MVEHAADVHNKYCVGQDGATPYERLKGKKWRGELFLFGSLVQHRHPGKPKGVLCQLAGAQESGLYFSLQRMSKSSHTIKAKLYEHDLL